jgi:hypothetical protein
VKPNVPSDMFAVQVVRLVIGVVIYIGKSRARRSEPAALGTRLGLPRFELRSLH